MRFPDGLSSDNPSANFPRDLRAVTIADAARYLVALGDHWLNPPEWGDWVDEPGPTIRNVRLPATRWRRGNSRPAR